tara:strand:- start:24 stop:554 length:531 start_codon:yes stop_codon:yes gene_type:complete
MSRKFDTIIESVMQRYQGTNFLVGDRVKFIENHSNHGWFTALPATAVERLNAIIESGDNIRVTAVTANRPSGTLPVHAPNVVGLTVDIAREQAPGLFTSPFSVPHDIIVLQEDGINLAGETPEGQIRKDDSHIKPKEHEADSDDYVGDKPELPTSNTDLGGKEPTPGESYTKNYIS